MKILLTINGHGKRFVREGILTPKFLLEWDGKTILDHILNSISDENAELIIGLNNSYDSYKEQIGNIVGEYLFRSSNLVWMDDTNGQAVTVSQLAKKTKLMPQDAFWVMNCDTIVEVSRQNVPDKIVVEVFHSNNPALSFIDGLDEVNKIVEKDAISNLASTGNYFFPSLQCFNDGFDESEQQSTSELYVSEVIQHCINQGYRACGALVEPGVVKLLGTPVDYEKALNNE